MIISKKKFDRIVQEKVCEALNQADKERWIHERIDVAERESCRRHEEVSRHLWELEKKIALLTEEEKTKGETK